MRPGNDLRIRIYAFLIEVTRGYRSEFAMMQVGREDRDGRLAKLVPITPAIISARLLKADRAEFRASDRPLSDAEAKKRRIRGPHIRRMLENMQSQDGTVTAVTVRKLLSHDAAIRRLGEQDLKRLIAERLSFQEALDQKLIVRICDLAKADRKRLAGRSFLYLHVRPRPATVAALVRRTDEDITLARTSKEIHAKMTASAQMAFKFLRALGVDDPQFAEQVSRLPIMATYVDQLVTAETSLSNIKGAIRDYLAPLVEARAHGESIDLPAAAAVQPELFTPPPPVLVSKPRAASTAANGRGVSDAEVYTVLQVMRRFSAADDDAAVQLIRACRAHAPSCTAVAICEAIEAKGPLARKKDNPVGFLITAVPNLFKGAAYQQQMREEKSRLKCWVCHSPLAGETIADAHVACWEAHRSGAANAGVA